MADLDVFPEDWERALAVVAHPDDMEYGAAAAVARWTQQGKHIAYVLVSDGEAGISTMAPARSAPCAARSRSPAAASSASTTSSSSAGPTARSSRGWSCAPISRRAIRRHRPEVVLSINFRDSWGGPSWNHPDHRAVGRALLDAVRDAANPWVFGDRGEAWDGVRFVAFSGSPQPTHGVDTTATFDAGVASLAAHRVYLEHLGGDMAAPDEFLRGAATAGGERWAPLAATFEIIG
jgi:LmbE family N-acetylglucosaminyl deacetylase